MSTLIIGVLFVVALVAIIALVFVLRSEPRSTGTVPANPAASATPDVAATSRPETATMTNESLPSMTSVPTVPTVPDVPSVPTATEESHLAMGNGQFHELAVELHTLHGQSQEIEHRLSILSEMIERIERSQDAHITEEYSSLVDRQSAN